MNNNPLEIITPQHLGKATEAALQAYGKQVTDPAIQRELKAMGAAKATFETAYIRAGLMLLARKASLKHGKFGPWLDAFVKNAKLVAFDFGEHQRTAQRMMWYARRFLYQLHDVAPIEQTLNGKPVSEGFALALQAGGDTLAKAIKQFVDGRSLDRLRRDLNEADKLAAREDDGEDDSTTTTSGEPVTEMQLSLQFYEEEVARPVHLLEESIKRPEFLALLQHHPEKLEEAELILAHAHRTVKKLVSKQRKTSSK